jgi:hypothetical protein
MALNLITSEGKDMHYVTVCIRHVLTDNMDALGFLGFEIYATSIVLVSTLRTRKHNNWVRFFILIIVL